MEARFGTDFSSVRIHDDAGAAAVAGRIDAAAFTTGNDIVFGTGHFDPRSPEGRHLLAHELAHVVQQNRSETGARMVHRRGVGEWLGILFGAEEGNWTTDELTEYLDLITRTGKIDGSYDADNKARAIVARWKAGDVAFAVNPAQKVLLIEEMLDGPTLIEDETAIVDLLVDGTPDDGATVLGPTGVQLDRIEADVDDKVQRARLAKWLTDSFAGGRDAVLAGRINTIQSTVEGFEALTTGTVAKDDAAPVVQVPKIVVDAMAEAWSKSFPKGKSKEQGGILVRKKDGSVEWIKATKSASGWTELPEEKIPKGGAGLVAGHTHPYDKSELKSIKDTQPRGAHGDRPERRRLRDPRLPEVTGRHRPCRQQDHRHRQDQGVQRRGGRREDQEEQGEARREDRQGLEGTLQGGEGHHPEAHPRRREGHLQAVRPGHVRGRRRRPHHEGGRGQMRDR